MTLIALSVVDHARRRAAWWFGIGAAIFVAAIAADAMAQAPAAPRAEPPALSASDIRKLFDQGNELFRSALAKAKADKPASAALFRDAAAAWRTIALKGGVHNARLETNIANASLLAGQLPQAIAAFRRGQALDPFDSTIRNGLAAARRAAGTEAMAPGAAPLARTDDASQGGVLGTLHRVGSVLAYAGRRTLLYLPERALLWTAALCYLGAFCSAGLRTIEVRRIPRRAPIALIVAAVLAAGPLAARDLAATPEGVIVSPGLVARNGPADLYDPAFKEPLAAGLEVRIQEQRPGWVRVQLTDGRSAWMPSSGLEPI